MAALTVIHGKGHRQMANSAKFALQDPVHGKVFRGLLLDIKDIGMAVVAIEPLRMHLVRENRGGNAGPFRFQYQWFQDHGS